VIAHQVGDRAGDRRPRAHGDARPAGVVVRRHRGRAAAPLEVIADVGRRRAAGRQCDAPTVAVVAVGGHRLADYLGQVVLFGAAQAETSTGLAGR